MKDIKKLSIKDIVSGTIDIDQLAKFRGGVREDVSQEEAGYGCESNVCSQNWTGHPCGSNSEICEKYVCTSGVAG